MHTIEDDVAAAKTTTPTPPIGAANNQHHLFQPLTRHPKGDQQPFSLINVILRGNSLIIPPLFHLSIRAMVSSDYNRIGIGPRAAA